METGRIDGNYLIKIKVPHGIRLIIVKAITKNTHAYQSNRDHGQAMITIRGDQIDTRGDEQTVKNNIFQLNVYWMSHFTHNLNNNTYENTFT